MLTPFKKSFYSFLLALGIFSTATFVQAGNVGDAYVYEDPYYSCTTAQDSSTNLKIAPTRFGYEFMGPMNLKRQNGHAKIQNAYLYMQLIKPEEKTSGLSLGLETFARFTWLSTSSKETIEGNQLYAFGLSGTGLYAFNTDTRLFFGASEMLASDLEHMTHNAFQLGMRAGISHRFNENFSGSLGLFYTPQFANNNLLPLITFRYKLDNTTYLAADPLRLKLMNQVSDQFAWGPFIGVHAGSWNVNTSYGHKRLSSRQGIVGLQFNYDFSKMGTDTPPSLILEVGSTMWNKFEYRSTNGKHEYMSVHAEPGFYMQAYISYRF